MHIHTLGRNTIPIIVQKIVQMIEIVNFQVVKIEITQKIDQKITPLLDHFIIIIIMDSVIILKIDTTTIRTYQEICSHSPQRNNSQ